jgi:aminoglycoside phosphotransferase (APT) family kinase protein
MLEPLRGFLRASGLPAPADLRAEPTGEGHSNVTFRLSTGVVLRRPPRGPLPPSAHDVLREARLLRALESTPVRAPTLLVACEDAEVIGAPFYVMEAVEGSVLTSAIPEPLDNPKQRSLIADELIDATSAIPEPLDNPEQCSLIADELIDATSAIPEPLDNPEQRSLIADELIDALVALHAVDWTAIGLETLGEPTGYVDRQLRRFFGLWETNKTREIEQVEIVGEWLRQNMPDSPRATIVHGDYRLGNTIVSATAPAKLEAILDWEMATIGDPLADIGYLMINWIEPDDRDDLASVQTVTTRAGFPRRVDMSPATSGAQAVRCTWRRPGWARLRNGGGGVSAQGVDLVRFDREDQACLVPPAVPRIWGPEVPLGELLDVLGGALAGDAQDRAPNRVIPGGVARVRDGHRDARIPPDVLDLLKTFDGVDQNMRTVRVDPGLGQLR